MNTPRCVCGHFMPRNVTVCISRHHKLWEANNNRPAVPKPPRVKAHRKKVRTDRPLTEPLASQALALLDDGCSYAETARTLRVHPRRVRATWPGRGMARKESGSLARAVRTLNEQTRLTLT